MSMLCSIVDSIVNFFVSFSNKIGMDILFAVALGVEVLFVIFFLIKSASSYEAKLNRALDKLNYWIFERKVITEENIKDINLLFKTKAPKRLCYYWQQYILFRDGQPSSYLSTENLVDKPLKTSSYNSNIKNLTIFTTIWALFVSMFVVLATNSETALLGKSLAIAILVPVLVMLIGVIFIVYLRARKNAVLNSLYQNVSTFGRFMDNACVDLPSYIDYQILFTPAEIQKGQPVLREFLDYKARKEKEEFQKAKEEQIQHETYDFESAGVDGSIVLDRAMKESELFLKKKEKILVKISQLEAGLDSIRKNFDNVQKDYQTKIQASKENINRLRQMSEETTNRIESNYYRKQQTQEIGKQEQFEQEFEQHRAKYILEKTEGEEEINKLNAELAQNKAAVEEAMKSEYAAFFDKFCKSAEKVVAKVFENKINTLKQENEKDKERINQLEVKLKNIPQGEYDGSQGEGEQALAEEGRYDENGNYVYPNGTYYDPDGNFHDENGNVYTQDGVLISKAEDKPVDLESFDAFDFMTDLSQKDNVYNVAENIIKDVDKENEIKVVERQPEEIVQPVEQLQEMQPQELESFSLEDETPAPQIEEEIAEDEEYEEEEYLEEEPEPATPAKRPGRPRKVVEPAVEEQPKRKAGRPRKVVAEAPVEKRAVGRPKKIVVEDAPQEEKRGRGRPKKIVEPAVEEQPKRKAGRPRKEVVAAPVEKKSVGRPKKIVKDENPQEEKRGRGRPKKQIESIAEINKKLSEEEKKINKMRSSIDEELENAVNEMNSNGADAKQKQREKLLKEIENLQVEAQDAINNNEPESRLIEINDKLEKLLSEISKLDN